MTVPLRTLTHEMLREEWRFYKRVVGSRAFVIFPVLISALTACLLLGGQYFHLAQVTMVTVAHLFVFAIGVHMGYVSFTSRGVLEDMLGGLTFLVSTSRTMPVSTERLVGVFLLKNVIYYMVMFTLPVAIGFLIIIDPLKIHLLLASFTGMYVWGVVTALLGVNVTGRGGQAKVVATLLLAAVAAVWTTGAITFTQHTPYALYANPGLYSVIASVFPLIFATVVGIRYFSPTIDDDIRVVNDQFKSWSDYLPTHHSAVATKAILGLNRGNGGLVKFVISTSLVFAVCLYLFTLLATHTPSEPFMGIAMGGFLGLEAVLTYLWLVRFDAVDEYATLPIDATRLVRGKFLAFGLITFPLAFAHYGATLLVFEITLLDAVLGLVLLSSMLVYFFAVPLAIIRFSPNKYLLHPVRFIILATALCVPLIGIFVLAFTTPALTPTVTATVLAVSFTALVVGIGALQSASRWEVTSE